MMSVCASWCLDIMSKPMTLKELIAALEGAVVSPENALLDAEVFGITEDSRRVREGFIFAALQGENHDGHAYIDGAVTAGAVAILTDRDDIEANVPVVRVMHTRRTLGLIAHGIQGNPSTGMTVVGVTGTNGKSSSVAMIAHILQSAGNAVASFGTLSYTIAGKSREAKHTTPFNEDLAELFAEARDAGVTHAVMEVSSHALAQERVAGIDFDVALFTNLTQDHLDFHASMEEYRDEKRKLFEFVAAKEGITIANAEDPAYEAFAESGARTQWSFGNGGEVFAENIAVDTNNTKFTLETPWGRARCQLGLLGQHNVENALGAVAVCGALGVSIDHIAEGLRTLPQVPGRFELIDCGQPFTVVVDYAHTDDGLRNVLEAARPLTPKTLRVVFGCGGDRDKGKRQKMAAAAADLADYAILTSDNPRSESPERILLDIEVGMQHAGKKRGEDYEVIESRRDAIETALRHAAPGDFVMIAGKGHEDYQILKDGTIHFDDREVAREWLEKNA